MRSRVQLRLVCHQGAVLKIGSGNILYGNTVIEANVPKDKRIPVTPEEASRFACNSVNVNDAVIFNQGSEKLADELKNRGFKVVQVDLSEFLKSGGSSKCLTLRVG